MANELLIEYPSSNSLYALLFDASGQVYNGATFEAPLAANWLTYDIALTEVAGTGIYQADMPAVAAGIYSVGVRRQDGASPAVGDDAVGTGEIRWSGTAVVAPEASTVFAIMRRLVADVDAAVFGDAEILELLSKSALADSAGLAPSAALWTPTYDLNRGAAEGWRRRAARLATSHFDFSADGASYQRSQAVAACERMAAQYARKIVSSAYVRSELVATDEDSEC